LLRVFNPTAEFVKLKLHASPTFFVIDGPAEVSDQPVHFVIVE
jgi:hypothetical protein